MPGPAEGGRLRLKAFAKVLYVIYHALLPLKRCGEFMCEALPPTLRRFCCFGGYNASVLWRRQVCDFEQIKA